MSENLSSLIRKNTMTNALVGVMRVLRGLLMARWMYIYLGEEYYGFWGLLWAVFFYVVVLDFGFSKAAQKATAERQYEHDPEHYNKVVGTVFSLQWMMSAVIVMATVAAMIWLKELTKVTDPGELSYCRKVLLIFGCGIALTFPTGVLPEILVGLKRIYLRNYVLLIGGLIEVVGTYVVLHTGGLLLPLTVMVIGLNLSANMVMLVMIKRRLPGLRLRPTFHRKIVRELADFSAFIYMHDIGSLIIGKTDRLVLSIISGLDAVGVYQIGTRLPDNFVSVTAQYRDNVAPLTADFLKRGQKDELCRTLIKGLRFTVWLAAGGAGVILVLTPEMLDFLFGARGGDAKLVCRLMVISAFFTVAMRDFAQRIMMMSGRHRLRCLLCWCEAVVNLGLSIYLTLKIGLIGVVIGTLVPNAIISLFVILPYYSHFIRIPIGRFLKDVYLGPVAAAVTASLAVWFFREGFLPWAWPLFVRLILLGLVYAAGYMVCSAYWVVSDAERTALWSRGVRLVRGRLKWFR
ncbi:MAG: lipopolysaccharide biosynthesis protein [Victivallaceae bacterium]|nr:oligosaccharide flippase family protein [Victivallaceae bacterium]